MKSTLRLAYILVFLSPLFFSCYSSKDITKQKPITQDFLSALEAGKRYDFELAIGQVQNIYVTGVDGDRVVGYLYPNRYSKKNKVVYNEQFENIAKNVVKISERKIDPVKTSLAILIPATVIIPIVIVINEGSFSGMSF